MAEPRYLDQGATFGGAHDEYRYRLWRLWDETKPAVAFIMLNPSTADAAKLDPTLRRCLGFARAWGFGAFMVGNLFALRSTQPKALYHAADPVGPDNDAFLSRIAGDCAEVVLGWGEHGRLRYRGDTVRRMLAGRTISYLRLTAKGEPCHPLYLPGDLRPTRYPRAPSAPP